MSHFAQDLISVTESGPCAGGAGSSMQCTWYARLLSNRDGTNLQWHVVDVTDNACSLAVQPNQQCLECLCKVHISSSAACKYDGTIGQAACLSSDPCGYL